MIRIQSDGLEIAMRMDKAFRQGRVLSSILFNIEEPVKK